ncbi:Glyoxalase/Bleomycin resistance protein/Dihydroxybiphenyl dioxygenase [Lophiostoma macrostomum CBS 122681]|uniref:Glyoxalase/Bleomycin resistance protein/Dihydroxybiphenyl dioxygenase n=1 Tax=Lophiostoma macrostomum CBS 122681 TaxID=1314788 RepID=A0A6A6SVZ9_9PLEO|nr:Glyoxalase/Bleomycin resistance protein/Dihydroxybiphenyl dioxygenase [Lophiostoma macrostomum CBS 122681]
MACNHANLARRAESNETLPFSYEQGNDSRADPATEGYFINHVALLISDVNATREWYSTVLGMRHVFTFDLAEKYVIMYMAHAQGGRNGTGFQTGEELVRDKNNLAGLVEYYQPDAASKKFDPTPRNTLSHMGLIVPDLAKAQDRFDELGVTIIKRAGVLDFSPSTTNQLIASAWGIDDLAKNETQQNTAAMKPGLEIMGFPEFIIIADPDGNLFEVQALVPTGI